MALVQSQTGRGRLLVPGGSPEPVIYALDIRVEGPSSLKAGRGTISGHVNTLTYAAAYGGALELENGFGLGIEISRIINNQADFVVSDPIPDR
jgi:hypothetical protein